MKRLGGISLERLLGFLRRLPHDMLLVLRIHTALNIRLAERFALNGLYATKGAYCERADEREERLRRHNDNVAEADREINRWYLFGKAPTLRRSLSYLFARASLQIRMWLLTGLMTFWKHISTGMIIDDI